MSIEVYLILIVLGIPVYFFWRWLLKKFIKVDRKRKKMTWLATIVLTPLLYVGIVLTWLLSISYYPSKDFSRQLWLKDKEKRFELSEDIIESRILLGKTKHDVRLLLGDEGNADESDDWSYYLGFRAQPFGIDPDVLIIEFKDGKVVRVGQQET